MSELEAEGFKRKLEQMEEKMRLLQDTHLEERNELVYKITELEAGIEADEEDGGSLAKRVSQLECLLKEKIEVKSQGERSRAENTAQSRHVSGDSFALNTKMEEDTEHRAREQTITLTFGDTDTHPSSLERFISHYELVDEINRERGVRVWSKASYRALMLRMALRGAAADYLEQESKLLSSWVKDDNMIIERLRARYIKNSAVELHIIAFETALQGEGEPLAEYMVRLQKLAHNAYTAYPEWINQNRIVWQFLNGARDRDVREAIIKEGWMLDNKTAKGYEDVLKIAEQVVNTKKATRATGKGSIANGGGVNAVSYSTISSRPGGILNSVSSSSVSSGSSGQSRKRSYPFPRGNKAPLGGGSRNRGGGRSTGTGNFFCYCCKTTDHAGGWKCCPKFRTEYPNWKQGDPLPNFQ